MKRIRVPLVAIIAVTVVLLIAGGARFLMWHNRPGPGDLGGPFTLVDGDGRVVTDATFRGRYMLIYFGYTFCPDVCPTTLATIAAALNHLPAADRARIAPLFVTIDPDRDSPNVVKDYARSFTPRMIGLTGSTAQIAAIVKAYHVYVRKVPGANGAYTMDHSSTIYVMGPDGRYLTQFPHGTPAAQMDATLTRLMS
jgi:protein SCO1/2